MRERERESVQPLISSRASRRLAGRESGNDMGCGGETEAQLFRTTSSCSSLLYVPTARERLTFPYYTLSWISMRERSFNDNEYLGDTVDAAPYRDYSII